MIPVEQHLKMIGEVEEKMEARTMTALLLTVLAVMRKAGIDSVTVTHADLEHEITPSLVDGVYSETEDGSMVFNLPVQVTPESIASEAFTAEPSSDPLTPGADNAD